MEISKTAADSFAELRNEHLRDKTKPHFSLAKMQPIPPYKGPKRYFVDLMHEVDMKVHRMGRDTWDIAIEILAEKLGIMTEPWKYSLPNLKWQGKPSKPSYPNFQELKTYIDKKGLAEAYIDAARKEPGDYIGDIFTEQELTNDRMGQFLTPIGVVEAMVSMVGITTPKKRRPQPDPITEAWLSIESMAHNHDVKKRDLNAAAEYQRLQYLVHEVPNVWEKYLVEPTTVLDPCSGTGRFLLVANWKAKQQIIMFGIELSVSMYRATLVNMALFAKYPYSIVCGDTLMIDSKHTSPASKLWDLGNQWDPPSIEPFYWKPIPPFKFSLQEIAKQRKQQPIPTAIVAPEPTAFSLAQMRAK